MTGVQTCALPILFLAVLCLHFCVRAFSSWASGGHSSLWCAGLSLSRPLLLQSTGSRRAGSVVVAHGPSCSAACGIFPDQGSNPCPLHWQADSQPLRQQGSPSPQFFTVSSPAHFLSHSRLWNLFKEFNIPFTEAIILFPFCTL